MRIMYSLYSNVGKKIQTLAKVLGLVFLGGSVIICLLSIWHVGYAVLSLLGGCIMFCFSWLLYGFGQMVEDMSELRKTGLALSKMQQTSNQNDSTLQDDEGLIDFVCPNCGKTVAFLSDDVDAILADEVNAICPWCSEKIDLT